MKLWQIEARTERKKHANSHQDPLGFELVRGCFTFLPASGRPDAGLRPKSHVKISFKRQNPFKPFKTPDGGDEMSMNFLNGMQIHQLKQIIVKGFRFSRRFFRENRFPVSIIPVNIDLSCFFLIS